MSKLDKIKINLALAFGIMSSLLLLSLSWELYLNMLKEYPVDLWYALWLTTFIISIMLASAILIVAVLNFFKKKNWLRITFLTLVIINLIVLQLFFLAFAQRLAWLVIAGTLVPTLIVTTLLDIPIIMFTYSVKYPDHKHTSKKNSSSK